MFSPEEGGISSPSTPLVLQGYTYDKEDGALEGTALRCSSSRDGELGTGSIVLATPVIWRAHPHPHGY